MHSASGSVEPFGARYHPFQKGSPSPVRLEQTSLSFYDRDHETDVFKKKNTKKCVNNAHFVFILAHNVLK